ELGRLSQAIASRAARDPAEIGAAAYDYLFHCGYVALAYWWARSVAAAKTSGRPEGFSAGKRATARFYFQRILPRTLAHAASIDSGVPSLMSLEPDHFGT
ncbi:MAG: acyl-CoA dehydrogenase C-terminal domain-containing protein, partial [Gammaproteobacteria bacterium]